MSHEHALPSYLALYNFRFSSVILVRGHGSAESGNHPIAEHLAGSKIFGMPEMHQLIPVENESAHTNADKIPPGRHFQQGRREFLT